MSDDVDRELNDEELEAMRPLREVDPDAPEPRPTYKELREQSVWLCPVHLDNGSTWRPSPYDGDAGICQRIGCQRELVEYVPSTPDRGAVDETERLRAAMRRAADKLECVGNQEPIEVASYLRDHAEPRGQ